MDIKGEWAIRKSKRGETVTHGEFARAVEAYADMVFRVAFSSLGRWEDAEDVTQEVFLKLWRSDRSFTSQEHTRFWLIRVTVNECHRAVRWYRRNVLVEDVPERPDAPESRELLDTVMDLPEKLRVAAYLFYYEGYSTHEIARLVSVPEATVRSRLARAREKLREILKEEDR